MKTATILIAFLFITTLKAQTFEWVKRIGGISDEHSESLNIDASGNIYITGTFGETVDFDPGPGTTNLTTVGGGDIFVQKMDASGNFLWARSFGGVFYDFVKSIDIDASGNIYTVGYFEGTVDFDPGTGTAKLTSAGEHDAFVQKMDDSGNFLWVKSFGGTSSDLVSSISIDPSGNLYITGSFSETVDFDPGTGTAKLTSVGSGDIFVQKMDASGNFLWAKGFGGNFGDAGNSIHADALGNVYTTGHFSDIADFDPGAGTTKLTSVQSDDIFVQKMDASGNFLWAKSFGGTLGDEGNSILTDASGNVYIAGHFQDTVDFNPGPGINKILSAGGFDIFVQKMDASGNFLWAKTFGGPLFDDGSSISIDHTGNLYTTGYFYATADFDPGKGTSNLTSAGNIDLFVQKMDASGNFLWARSFGGVNYEQSSSISVDTKGSIYTLGYFNETADFDPGAGISNLTSAGALDVFVQKIKSSNAGIGASVNKVKVSASPNPTTRTVLVAFEQATNDVEIVLTDLYGKVIFGQTYNFVSNATIELKGAKGIYFLTIKTPEGQSSIKLMKD